MNETPQPLLDENGNPLIVPHGVFTDGIRESVERAIKNNVGTGKRAVVLGVVDPSGAKFGVAARLDEDGDWGLSLEAQKAWSGPVKGQLMIYGSF